MCSLIVEAPDHLPKSIFDGIRGTHRYRAQLPRLGCMRMCLFYVAVSQVVSVPILCGDGLPLGLVSWHRQLCHEKSHRVQAGKTSRVIY